MSVARGMRHALVWTVAAGMISPAQLVSADNKSNRTGAADAAAFSILDVALGPEGLLTGQLLDERMRPMADVTVTIQANEHTVAQTRTDPHGAFAVAGLHGGVHTVSAAETTRVLRLWAAGTAPPRAAPGARIVSSPIVVRGQWGGGSLLDEAKVLATNPFFVGGVIAAAVAIPVVLKNTDDDPPASGS